MKSSTKFLLVGAAGIILLTHFTLTGIYSFQSLPVPETVRTVSNSYAIPFFHQNWKLFAPEMPNYDCFLWVRTKENLAWSTPFRISEKADCGYSSKVTYMEFAIANSLASELAANMYWENGQRNLSKVEQSLSYGRAVYFAERMCRRHLEMQTDSIQVQLHFHFHERGKTNTQTVIEFSKTGLKKV
jgi:Family of unknown function (DUF5819)